MQNLDKHLGVIILVILLFPTLIQSILFKLTLDTMAEFVKMIIWLACNLHWRGES